MFIVTYCLLTLNEYATLFTSCLLTYSGYAMLYFGLALQTYLHQWCFVTQSQNTTLLYFRYTTLVPTKHLLLVKPKQLYTDKRCLANRLKYYSE